MYRHRQTDAHLWHTHTQTEQAAHAIGARNDQMRIAVLSIYRMVPHDFSASASKLRNRTLFCNLCKEQSVHYFVFGHVPVTKGLIQIWQACWPLALAPAGAG